MRIKLRGCTSDVITGGLFPEATAAAYARISRKPVTLCELHEEALADLEGAQSSCDSIVYGMGHAAVQEHAVLQFDIEGVSRLAVEAIEQHRLASYLERSYRYCPVKQDEIYLPGPLRASTWAIEAQDVIAKLFKTYKWLVKELSAHFAAKGGLTKKQVKQAAQEDARYVLPLAITTSLGMTINCRSLSHMIASLRAQKLTELAAIADKLELEARTVAPSLLRHAEPSAYANRYQFEFKWKANEIEDMRSEEYRTGGDKPFIAEVSWTKLRCGSANLAATIIDAVADESEIVALLTMHDQLPRPFETLWLYSHVIGSAVFYAQLKRHRMATIIPEKYSTTYGCHVPASINDAGLTEPYFTAIQEAWNLYYKLLDSSQLADTAEYLLPNATRRGIEFQCNFRELAHFCRLRRDAHAQAEIRSFADQLIDALKKTAKDPKFDLIAEFLFAGRDRFDSNKAALIASLQSPEV